MVDKVNSNSSAASGKVTDVARLGVRRAEVQAIRVVDTDMVILLTNGKKLFIRDGAVRAMMDPNFTLAFTDDEMLGRDVLQQAGPLESTPLSTTTATEVGTSTATPESKALKQGSAGLTEGAREVGSASNASTVESVKDAQSSPLVVDKGFFASLNPAWGAVGALGALGGIGGSSAATATASDSSSAVVSGVVMLGPALTTNDLKIVAYDAAGNVVGITSAISSSGSYSIKLTAGYRGVVILKLTDTGTGLDYADEATSTSKSLGSTQLRAVTYVNGSVAVVNITPLTELAALKMSTATSTATSTLGNPTYTGSSTDLVQINKAVASAFKLSSDEEITTLLPRSTVDTNGQTTTTANGYGAVLAILSGAETQLSQTTSQVLSTLSSGLTVNSTAGTGSVGGVANDTLIRGANLVATQINVATAGSSTAIGIVNNILSITSTDVTPPTVIAVTDNVSASVANGPVTFTVTLSESLGVTLSTGNFTATHGSVDSVSKIDDTHYAVHVTPTASLAGGNMALSIQNLGGVVDLSNNPLANANLAGFDSQALDTLAPSVLGAASISGVNSSYVAKTTPLLAGDKIKVIIAMSEAVVVSGVPTFDINVGGVTRTATYSASNSTATSMVFYYEVAGADALSTGAGGVTAIANALMLPTGSSVVDAASNTANLSTSLVASGTNSLVVDNNSPSVLSVTDNTSANVTNAATVFEITFSTALNQDLTSNNFTVSNGTVTAVTKFSTTVYHVTATPSAGVSSGTMNLSLIGGGVTSLGGSPLVDADLSIQGLGGSQAIDTAPPTLAITSDKSALKAGETATITFTFSEAPVGFATGDIVVANGTISGLAVTADTKVYTATFTPTASLASGSASITVASGAYTDAATNIGEAGATPSIMIDMVAPTVSSVTDNISATTTNAPISFSVHLSEALTTDLTTASFTVTNAALTSVTKVSATEYTVVATPTANLASGSVSLSLVANGETDSVGNTLQSMSLSSLDTQAVDTVSPTLLSNGGSSYSTGALVTNLTSGVSLFGNASTLSIQEAGRIASLRCAFNNFLDFADEQLVVNGVGYYLDGVSLPDSVTVSGVAWVVSYDNGNFVFTAPAAGATTSNVRALLVSLSYKNSATTPTDGTREFVLSLTDQSGNVQMSPLMAGLVVSTTAPPAIVSELTALSNDTGIAADFATSVTSQSVTGKFTGALRSGDTIQVSANGGSTWISAVVTGAGTWLANGVTLSALGGTLTARIVDASANVSAMGHASRAYSVIAAPTAAIAITSVVDAVSSGYAAGDGVGSVASGGSTNDTRPVISGTLTNLAGGALTGTQSVQVYDGGTLLAGSVAVTTTSSTTASWSFTTGSSLAVGSHALTARISDAGTGLSKMSSGYNILENSLSVVRVLQANSFVASNTPTLARYVYLRRDLASGSDVWFGFNDIAVMSNGLNVGLGKSITSSGFVNNFGTSSSTPLTDGNSASSGMINTTNNTGVGMPTNTGWIQVDLGANYLIDSVIVNLNGYTAARSNVFISTNDLSSFNISQLSGSNPPVAASSLGAMSIGSTQSIQTLTSLGSSNYYVIDPKAKLAGTLAVAIDANQEELVVFENGVKLAGVMSVQGTEWTFVPSTDFSLGQHNIIVQLRSTNITHTAVMAQSQTLNVVIAGAPTQIVAITGITDAVSSDGMTVNGYSLPDRVGSSVALGMSINDTRPVIAGTLSASLTSGQVLAIYDNSSLMGSITPLSATWSYTPSSALVAGLHTISAKVINTMSGVAGSISSAVSVVENSLSAVSIWQNDGSVLRDTLGLVRYVMLRRDTPGNVWMGFNEIEVMSNGVNVARGKSYTSQGYVNNFGGSTSSTILTDGSSSLSGMINTTGNPLGTGTGWIQIDLGGNYAVDSLAITSSGWGTSASGSVFLSKSDMSVYNVAQLSGTSSPITVAALGNITMDGSTTTVQSLVTRGAANGSVPYVTNARPTLSGTMGASMDATQEQLALYDNGTLLVGTLIVQGKSWSFVPTSNLSTGLHTVVVQIESTDGLHTARLAKSQVFTVGTAVTPTAVVTISSVTDSLASYNKTGSVFGDSAAASTTSGGSTNDTLPMISGTFTGTLNAGDVIEVFDGTKLLGNAIVSGSSWSLTMSTALAAGVHNLTAKAINLATATPLSGIDSNTFVLRENNITASVAPRSTSTVLGGASLVRYIMLRKDVTNATWDVGDLQVYSNGVNVALGKTVSVGSQTGPIAGTLTSLVDGNSATVFQSTNATTTAANYWVQVDLGGLYAVGSIVLTPSTVGSRLQSTYVYAAATDMTSGLATNVTANTSPTVSSLAFGSVSASFAGNAAVKLTNAATMLQTSDTTPVFSGTLGASLNAAVEVLAVYDNGTRLGTATVVGTSWRYTPTAALTTGTHALQARIESTSGAVLKMATEVTFRVGSAVSLPTTTLTGVLDNEATNGSITGLLSAGDSTDATRMLLSGNVSAVLSANESVGIFDGTTLLGTAVLVGTNWTFTPPTALTAGAHQLSAAVVSNYNGAKGASSSIALYVETAPTVVVAGAVGGYSLNSKPDLSGVMSAILSTNEVVGVYDNGNRLGTASMGLGGLSWSFAMPSVLTTGGHTFTAQIEDATAGSYTTGKAVGRSFVIISDSKVPTQTATLTSALDDVSLNGSMTGVIANGTSTDDATLTLSGNVVGALAAGYGVAVYDGLTRLGAATVSGASWSMTTSALTAGSHSLTAVVENLGAGVKGTSSTAYVVKQQALDTFTVYDNLTSKSTSGGQAVYVTDRAPTFSGTLATALANTEVLAVYDNGVLLGTVAPVGTSWTFTPNALAFNAGVAHNVTLQVQDGTTGSFTTGKVITSFVLTVDSTVPTANVTLDAVVDAVGADQGQLSNNHLTDDVALHLSGTVSGSISVGQAVAIYDGSAFLGYGTVSNGVWSYVSSGLAVGTHMLSAVVENRASGVQGMASSALTIDEQSIAWSSLTDDAGAALGNLLTANSVITDDTSLTFTGSLGHALAMNQTLKVYDAGFLLGTATFASNNTDWTFASSLGVGTHSLSVQIENTSATGVSLLRTATQTVVVQTQETVLSQIGDYTINVQGVGQTLDLSSLSNSYALNMVNIQGSLNTLKLNLNDVLAANTDLLTGVVGWSGALSTGAHQMVVGGATGTIDALDASGTWASAGTASYTANGVTSQYAVYNHLTGMNVDAQLLIDSHLTRTGAVL